jgi:predicted transcriptional regulator
MMATHAIHPTGVKLDAGIKTRLKKLSGLKRRTMHWIMKEAITQYLDHEEQAEKLKQETLARWEEAEQNNVVAHKPVMAWLDTWGTDNETKRPPCNK